MFNRNKTTFHRSFPTAVNPTKSIPKDLSNIFEEKTFWWHGKCRKFYSLDCSFPVKPPY